MLTSSCKAKGRRLCQKVKEMLHAWAPDIHDQDICVTSSGANGADVTFSKSAQEIYPFSIECKNTEALNVWKAFQQAESHVQEGTLPLLVFSRNRSDILCCLKFDDLLRLIR